MNPYWKDKLILAITSGHYKKCENRLRRGHQDGSVAYCTLGVLGEIMGMDLFTTTGVEILQAAGMDKSMALNMVATIGMKNDLCSYQEDGTYKKPTFDEMAKWLKDRDDI